VSALRFLGWLLVAVVALVALAYGGARLWLRSDRGQAYVRRTVERTVAEHGGGAVRLGRIRGSLLSDARIEGFEARLPQKNAVFHAASVEAHYSPWRLLSHRELPLSRVTVRGGTLEAAGRRVDDIALDARGTIGGRSRFGDRGNLTIERLRARAEGVPFDGSGRVAWNGARLGLDGVVARVGTSRVVVDGELAGGRADLRLHGRAGPAELQALAPLLPPRTEPVLVTARLRGPRSALHLDGTVSPGRGRIELRALIDAERRRLHGDLVVHELAVDAVLSEATVFLDARGRVDGALSADGRRGRARLGLDGTYQRRRVDPSLVLGNPAAAPSLARRYAERLPGGAVRADATLRLRDGALAGRARAELSDPGQAARLVRGRELVAKAPTLIVWGTLARPQHGAARLRVGSGAPPSRLAHRPSPPPM
jgi:hypothetical protein